MVFNLFAIEGYKHSEIAEKLGVSESTSKSQLFKARKLLQQIYIKMNKVVHEDNRIHVKNGNMTEIQTFGNQLSESRLRHVQMNFPMHVEWDFSKNKTYDDGRVRDRTNKSVRFGIGGFVGFKLGTRQYLEYKDAKNIDVEEVQYDNFNMNTINYGLSTYLGYRDTSFYVKYDLNPLFKNTNTRNISIGVRLDLN